MITIELMGGLGNQLFQIFVVMALAYKYNLTYYFPSDEITHGWRKTTYWTSLLSELQSKVKAKTLTISRITIKEPHFEYMNIENIIAQYITGEDNVVLQNDIEIYLFGYFQSWKYFDHYKENIFKCIKLNTQQQILKQKMMDNNITQECFDNMISMHFRLGDYKNKQEHHPIMPIEYYKNALHHIMSYTNKDFWNIMIICEDEDIDTVNQNIDILEREFPKIVVNRISNLEDWEQMLAMSLCKHNIIANSSFSWFGAYFNQYPDKVVCYPNKWFGPAQGNKNLQDLCPNEWKKIIV